MNIEKPDISERYWWPVEKNDPIFFTREHEVTSAMTFMYACIFMKLKSGINIDDVDITEIIDTWMRIRD
jgi:hypothetical protein